MSETVVVPATRDVRGTLDTPDGGSRACVVACPPHPQHGGSRSDRRLAAVADALRERGVACLRIDYGPWDEGRGECRDARAALSWARDRYDIAGAFGYSFGGTVALVATARERTDDPDPVAAVSTLAPAPSVGTGDAAVDAFAALETLDCPVQVVVGERDETVDWRPLVERARERGFAVALLAADHHFVGQADAVADRVAEFLGDALF